MTGYVCVGGSLDGKMMVIEGMSHRVIHVDSTGRYIVAVNGVGCEPLRYTEERYVVRSVRVEGAQALWFRADVLALESLSAVEIARKLVGRYVNA